MYTMTFTIIYETKTEFADGCLQVSLSLGGGALLQHNQRFCTAIKDGTWE